MMQVDNKPCYVNVCDGAGMGLHKTDKMLFLYFACSIFSTNLILLRHEQ